MDAMKQYMTVYSHKVGRPIQNVWASDSNAGMLSEFVAAIHEQRLPVVTGEDGLRAAEIVAAAYESEVSGQPVKIG